ncbi:hypothetical protein J4457_05815 [Candidatus Woesearchaeota archaeon]|nr:hypothetical protein [Candidatus Woesearchaeota archaeon]
MTILFEIKDKTGRQIRLTPKQWKHIQEHPEMTDKIERIRETLEKPDKIFQSPSEPKVHYYFKYDKTIGKYLLVAVKYLNGQGFIITSFYSTKLAI